MLASSPRRNGRSTPARTASSMAPAGAASPPRSARRNVMAPPSSAGSSRAVSPIERAPRRRQPPETSRRSTPRNASKPLPAAPPSSAASSKAVSRTTSRGSSPVRAASRGSTSVGETTASSRASSPTRAAVLSEPPLAVPVGDAAGFVGVVPVPVKLLVEKENVEALGASAVKESWEEDNDQRTETRELDESAYVVLHWEAMNTPAGRLCICSRWWPVWRNEENGDHGKVEEVFELAAELEDSSDFVQNGHASVAPVLLWDVCDSIGDEGTPQAAVPESNPGRLEVDVARCCVVSKFDETCRLGVWSLRLAWHCSQPDDRQYVPRAIQACVQRGTTVAHLTLRPGASSMHRLDMPRHGCLRVPLRSEVEVEHAEALQRQQQTEIRLEVARLRARCRQAERRAKVDSEQIEQYSAALAQRPSRQEVDELREQLRLETLRRRSLQEELMSLRGRIRTFCRIRGLCPGEAASMGPGDAEAVVCGTDNEVLVPSLQRRFEFDLVFGQEAPTSQIWDEVWPLVESVFDQPGSHACVIAYGQTGAGKTFTMEGTTQHPGLVKRTLECLYARAEGRLSPTTSAREVEISVSMLEIYQENVFDLLSTSYNSTARSPSWDCGGDSDDCTFPAAGQRLQMRQDGGEFGPEVRGLRVVRPASCADALALYRAGARQRRLGASERNTRSSRSHMVFSIQVKRVDRSTGEASAQSKISLVDLAGSERQRTTTVLDRARIGEACSINRSLTALGKVVQACVLRASATRPSERDRIHVPYRDSALTRLLSDSIGGQAKTLLIAHVTPLEADVQESYRTLQFTTSAACVQEGAASRNDEERCLRQAARMPAENKRVFSELQEVTEEGGRREQKHAPKAQEASLGRRCVALSEKENQPHYACAGKEPGLTAEKKPPEVVPRQPLRSRYIPVSGPWNLI